jgi:hypothetical protein
MRLDKGQEGDFGDRDVPIATIVKTVFAKIERAAALMRYS